MQSHFLPIDTCGFEDVSHFRIGIGKRILERHHHSACAVLQIKFSAFFENDPAFDHRFLGRIRFGLDCGNRLDLHSFFRRNDLAA